MGVDKMYQITQITDKEGAVKAEGSGYVGCVGEAKMEEGCVLFHCSRDSSGAPCDRFIRTSLVQNWKKDKESGRIVVETMNSVYYMDPLK